jgi:hypothetical protein
VRRKFSGTTGRAAPLPPLPPFDKREGEAKKRGSRAREFRASAPVATGDMSGVQRPLRVTGFDAKSGEGEDEDSDDDEAGVGAKRVLARLGVAMAR